MTHAAIVRRDPFRSSTAWTDAPDVQFIWERTLDEVDECGVRRPQRKVTVEPGGRSKDGLPLRSAGAGFEKKRGGRGQAGGREGGNGQRARQNRHSLQKK